MARIDKQKQNVIYLDYHASTQVDHRVMAKMVPYFTEQFGNPHAVDHAAGWLAEKAIDAAARQIAEAIGADPDEVIFTSGATEANNLAILGLARRKPPSRTRILVSAIEHKCVFAAANAAKSLGITVELIPTDSQGFVRLDALRGQIGDDVLLVSVMAVNNEIGTVQPIGEISQIAHAAGSYVHTDAVQALAAGKIEVGEWEVDLLSLSGHKIYGPKGIGALFVRRNLQARIEPLIYGGGQQNGLRSGTVPVPLCVGLAAAIELMVAPAADQERARVKMLRDRFVSTLRRRNPQITVNGPSENLRHPGNANICFNGRDAQDLLGILQPHLAASTGSACTSGITAPSHVLSAIGLSSSEAGSSVRFSIGRFTKDQEIDEAVELISAALEKINSRR